MLIAIFSCNPICLQNSGGEQQHGKHLFITYINKLHAENEAFLSSPVSALAIDFGFQDNL